MMEQLTKILSLVDAGKAKLLAALAGLVALIWVSRRTAVEQYKDEANEDADRRARAANDAASDALRLSPDQRFQRMRDKGWFRD